MSIRTAILALNPTIYWPLDTLDSPLITDASGNGHTGTLIGAVSPGVPGPETGTLALGTSAFDSGVQLSGVNPLVGTGPFTWMGWYASGVFSTTGHLMLGNGTPGGANGEAFYLANAALNLIFNGIGTVPTGQALLSLQWQQICFSISPGVIQKAYVDGVLVFSPAAGVPHAVTAGDIAFFWSPDPAQIAHAAFWNRQLSDAEVLSVWTAGPGLVHSSPISGRTSTDVDILSLETKIDAASAQLAKILAAVQHTFPRTS